MIDGSDSPKQEDRLRSLARAFILAAILITAWLLWSGMFKPLQLGLGVFSVALTLYLLHRMNYFTNEAFAFRYSPRLLIFWLWLGKEIIASSLQVTRIILKRQLRVEPRLVTLDVSDMEPVDQALLGNSITLTPGTLTLNVNEGRILVHSLTLAGAQELKRGEMRRRVVALRRG